MINCLIDGLEEFIHRSYLNGRDVCRRSIRCASLRHLQLRFTFDPARFWCDSKFIRALYDTGCAERIYFARPPFCNNTPAFTSCAASRCLALRSYSTQAHSKLLRPNRLLNSPRTTTATKPRHGCHVSTQNPRTGRRHSSVRCIFRTSVLVGSR